MGVMKTNAAPSSASALSGNGEAIDCCVREIYKRFEMSVSLELAVSVQLTPAGD